jgi:hypothetical protein
VTVVWVVDGDCVASLSGTIALSSVELVKVVTAATPLNSTTEDAVKPVPVIVRVLPSGAEVASRGLMDGAGVESAK